MCVMRSCPLEPEIEEEDEIPRRIRQRCKDMGLFGFAIPEEYGGLGLSMERRRELVFELGYTTPSLRSMFGTNNGIAGHVLMLAAAPSRRPTWLPRVASGEVDGVVRAHRARRRLRPVRPDHPAVRDGDGWVINGAKRYITNAPVADVFMVFARTDPDAPAEQGHLRVPGRRRARPA